MKPAFGDWAAASDVSSELGASEFPSSGLSARRDVTVDFFGASVGIRPDRLVEPGAWVEHIPFLMWLMEKLRPRLFVELGVHTGNSYCAACQAVSTLHLATVCRGIDTWRGDEHAGFYDDAVRHELAGYHDPLYGGFSRLMRMTFDEALPSFANGSIDLLHIDGLHTYGAVRHDFISWLPKVAEGGVILFHDTNERQRDMEVWKLWAELSRRYPSVEFLHGHGLGVLLPNGTPPFLAPYVNGDAAAVASLRAYFAALGRTNTLELAQQSLRRENDALKASVQQQQADILELRAQHAVERSRVAALSERHAKSLAHGAELTDALARRNGEFAVTEKILHKIQERLLDHSPLIGVFAATARLVCRVYERNERSPLGATLRHAPGWPAVRENMKQAQEAEVSGQHLQACEIYHEAAANGLAILKKLRRNPLSRTLLRGHVVNSLQEQLNSQARTLREIRRAARAVARAGRVAPVAGDAVFGIDVEFYAAQANRVFFDAAAAFRHYEAHGWRLGLQPHPLFDASCFLQGDSNGEPVKENPLVSYRRLLEKGEAPEAHPQFPGDWLRKWFWETSPKDLRAGVEPLPAIPVEAAKATEFQRLRPRLAIGVILFETGAAELAGMLRVIDRAASIAVRDGNDPPVIVLTDNSHQWSEAALSPHLRGLSTPVHFYPTSSNEGFGAGHNHLMRHAFGELEATHYLCLNPDGYLHPHAISELLAASGRQDRPTLIEAIQVPSEHPKDYDADTLETNWNTGGCLLIPRFLQDLTGGFDERFFMYCEDVDLSWRVWALGYRCLIAPRAFFHHRLASRTHSPRLDQWFLESGRLLGYKWNCPRFQLTCEQHIVRRGYRSSAHEFPAFDAPSLHRPHERVDFGHMFTFARARW